VPALVEADDDGLYVVKLLGAGHGRKALVAELLAGEIGRHLGLPVPDLVLVELDPALAKAEPDGEIKDLLERSAGTNVGLDFLPGALAFAPAVGPAPEPDLAANVVWLDALTTNVDRTARNPNLIVWHRRLHLIDHGSALYVHHTWKDPAEHAAAVRGGPRPRAAAVRVVDRSRRRRLAPLLSPALLERLTAAIPDDWLLRRRVARSRRPPPRLCRHPSRGLRRCAFVSEAERARAA
jgi:hypothetical protein